MKGKRAGVFVMITIVAVIMVIAVLLINQTTIFQEGNPLPVFGGIWRLTAGGEAYAQINDAPVTYITKAEGHEELFAQIEKAHNVTFKQQSGSEYAFEGEGGKLTVTARKYSRSFLIWEVKSS